MQHDPAADAGMLSALRRRQPRRPWLQLLNALLELAEGQGELLRHAERPWASVTFSGSRHTVVLRFTGEEAVAAGERYIAALAEHEFTLSRQIVADAAVVAVAQDTLPRPHMTVEAELLLLDDR